MALRRVQLRRLAGMPAPPCSRSKSSSTAPLPTRATETRVFQGEEKPVILDSSKHAVGYLSDILNARVYDVVNETPLELASNLSAQLNNNVFLKREVSPQY